MVHVVVGMKYGPGYFVKEASEIGLRPGDWPGVIRLEEGVNLYRCEAISFHGEAVGFTYKTASNVMVLNVYND